MSRTAMSTDGGAWIYTILNSQWFRYDWPHKRFSSFLFQLPSVLTINLMPTAMGKEIAIDLFSFSYIFHPVISILICYFVLKKENKINLLVYPLLTFASVVLSSLFFGVGISNEAISYFWPLLFIVLKKEHRYLQTLIVLILSLCLSYSYELSLGLLLLAFIANIFQVEKTIARKLSSLAILAGILNLLWIIIRINALKVAENNFFNSFTQVWTTNLHLLLAMGVLFFISSYLADKGWRYFKKFFYLFGIILLTYSIDAVFRTHNLGEVFMSSHYARTIVVPAGFTIALMMLIFEGYIPRIKPPLSMSSNVRELLLISTLLILNFGTVYNYVLTKHWSQGIKKLNREIAKHDMCFTMDKEYFDKEFVNTGITHWPLSFVTAALNEGFKLKTILFTKMITTEKGLAGFNSCHSLHNDRLYTEDNWYLEIDLSPEGKGLFDFSHILKNVKPLPAEIKPKSKD